MNKRTVKKIIKRHGRWYPVDGEFIKPESVDVTYFSLGSYDNRIPQRKLIKFYPYNCLKMRYIYGIDLKMNRDAWHEKT